MRTIKFRVRNQHTKEIEATEYLDENGVWWYIRTGESQKYQGVLLGGYLREQFTGLLDKNGKEIYEGDIVQVDWGIKEEYLTVNKYDKPFVIEFRGYEYAPFSRYLPTPDCVEVIGNIYENEDLLSNSTYGK